MARYDSEAGQQPIKMPAIAHSVFSRLEKMRAIRSHASQFYSPESTEPTTRISEKTFLQQIEWRMRYYGSLIGVAAGEAFYVREALNVDDPVALLTRPMNIYS
jgi:hypothetical protein